MFRARDALESRTEYVCLRTGRWQATYKGFVTVVGEGKSPRDCQYHLESAFDKALAILITRTALKGAPIRAIRNTSVGKKRTS